MSHVLCPNCHANNRRGARFCSGCGQTLGSGALSGVSRAPHASVPVSQGTAPHTARKPLSPQAGTAETGKLASSSLLNNRYLILKKVGQGGMGAVYMAQNTQTTEIVAVKELSSSNLHTPDEKSNALKQFRREGQLLMRLHHPNLPKVSDAFAIGERHYLVMEFVEGETLQQKMERRPGGFAETEVVEWTIQLCNVLDYLHSHSPPVIFRDLKPGNIMVTPSGHVKLIDFGIVRFFKQGQTKDTTLLGTPGYAAPEQFGSGQSEPRSDIYSLGVTLHTLLTGAEPEAYPSCHSPRQTGALITTELDSVIRRATALEKTERFPHVLALKQALPATTLYQAHRPDQAGRQAFTTPVNTASKSRRPTTQLLMRTAHLTNNQLLALVTGFLVASLAVLWISLPWLYGTWFWYNVSSISFVAPFIFAATRKKWAAGLSYMAVAMAGALAIQYQTGMENLPQILVRSILSALAIEGMINVLPRILGNMNREEKGVWLREISWLGLTAIIAHIILLGWNASHLILPQPQVWTIAFVLAAAGWFFGDLVQGYLYLRQTGLASRK